MTEKEFVELIDTSSGEVINVLTSMKGLLILSEHYANPPETNSYLTMLSACVTKVEEIMQTTRNKSRGIK
jgi:hypothetical protein